MISKSGFSPNRDLWVNNTCSLAGKSLATPGCCTFSLSCQKELTFLWMPRYVTHMCIFSCAFYNGGDLVKNATPQEGCGNAPSLWPCLCHSLTHLETPSTHEVMMQSPSLTVLPFVHSHENTHSFIPLKVYFR